MTLMIRTEKKVVIERVRTVEFTKRELVYYRESYYPGERHALPIEEVIVVIMFEAGHEKVIYDKTEL